MRRSKAQRKEEALQRQKIYEKRTIKEQLELIKTRPGKSKKELERLLKQMEDN